MADRRGRDRELFAQKAAKEQNHFQPRMNTDRHG